MRFRYRMDKNRSLGAGILLARGLFTDGIPLEDAVIKEGSHGKPYLAGVRKGDGIEPCEYLHFSLSHAGDYVVAAFADVPVGIDIEQEREYRPALVKRCLCEEERQALESCRSDAERRDLFLRYWTIKESAAKVSGLGMQIPFSDIRMSASCRIEVKWQDNLWKYFCREIEIPNESDILCVNEIYSEGAGKSGYRIAVCVEEKEPAVQPVWEDIQYEEI